MNGGHGGYRYSRGGVFVRKVIHAFDQPGKQQHGHYAKNEEQPPATAAAAAPPQKIYITSEKHGINKGVSVRARRYRVRGTRCVLNPPVRRQLYSGQFVHSNHRLQRDPADTANLFPCTVVTVHFPAFRARY